MPNIPGYPLTLHMQMMYMEHNIAGNALYAADRGAVKLVVGSFPDLFGTAVGRQLQRWCYARRCAAPLRSSPPRGDRTAPPSGDGG